MHTIPRNHLRALTIATVLLAATVRTPIQAQTLYTTPSQNTVSVAALRIPDKAWAHLSRAHDAAVARREPEFEAEVALALAIEPKFAEVYILRATHAADLGDYEKSLAYALEAQRIDPYVHWATLVRVSDCNALHRFTEARALLNSLPAADAPSWAVNYERTRTAIGLADAEAALRFSAIALQTVPESFRDNAHLLRANALQLSQRLPEAIAELQAYLDSPRPQPLRARVEQVLETTRRKLQQPQVAELGTH
jgi:tetratricopeptide (TPR) repeat protein